LTVDSYEFDTKTEDYECLARIPNHEVQKVYNTIINDWLKQNSSIKGITVNLIEKDYESFADNLQSLLVKRYDSALFTREENSVEEVYHSLLLAELNKNTCGGYYELLPEQNTGKGRADILFIDKERKVVVPIELKRTGKLKNLARAARDAVEQAVEKRYGDDPKYEGYEKYPAMGVSFCGTNLCLKIDGQKESIFPEDEDPEEEIIEEQKKSTKKRRRDER
jgi:hypothetical protein